MNDDYMSPEVALMSLLLFVILLLLLGYLNKKQDVKNLESENRELRKELRKFEDEQNPDEAQKRLIRQQWTNEFYPNRDWVKALSALTAYTERFPEDSFGCFYKAYVLHELKRTHEAIAVMRGAVTSFNNDERMHLGRINLACYECSLGNLEKAKEWLLEARQFRGAEYVRRHVETESELANLRPWVRSI